MQTNTQMQSNAYQDAFTCMHVHGAQYHSAMPRSWPFSQSRRPGSVLSTYTYYKMERTTNFSGIKHLSVPTCLRRRARHFLKADDSVQARVAVRQPLAEALLKLTIRRDAARQGLGQVVPTYRKQTVAGHIQ